MKAGSGEAGFCTGGALRKQLKPAIVRDNNGDLFPSGLIVLRPQRIRYSYCSSIPTPRITVIAELRTPAPAVEHNGRNRLS